MSKHTPGPWTVEYDEHAFIESDSAEQSLAAVYLNIPEAAANARLMAAAPLLLEALSATAHLVHEQFHFALAWSTCPNEPCPTNRAAIAAATEEPS